MSTIALVAAMVLLGACGSGSGSSTPPSPTTSLNPGAIASDGPSDGPASTSSRPPRTYPSSSNGFTGSAPGSRCAASALAPSIQGVTAAAGSASYTIALRNAGTRDCALNGYPGLSLVAGANGTQIGAAARRNSTATAILVSLAPGAVTTFEVRVAQAGNYPQDTCRPTAARGFRIYPPGSRQALFLAGKGLTGCAVTSTNVLVVGPVGVDSR